MNTSRRILTMGLLAGLAACQAQSGPQSQTTQTDNSADVAALRQMNDQEMAALQSGDLDAIMAVYTSDIHMMPPDEPAVDGAEALRTSVEGMLQQFTMSGRYTSVDAAVYGDVGIARYTGEITMTPKAGGEAVKETIKGIHVFRRQPDGKWKIAQDVWNKDPAPSAGM